MYSIKYIGDGDTQETIDINKLMKIAVRPVIPVAEKVVYTTDLGDGTKYYEESGYYLDRTFTLSGGFTAEEPDEWQALSATIQAYFSKSSGKLYLPDDDPETFWKVKYLSVKIDGRALGQMSNISLGITAYPFQFLTRYYDREFELTVNDAVTSFSIHNPYDSSSPVYDIYPASDLSQDITVENSATGISATLSKPFTSITSGKTVKTVTVDPTEYTVKQTYTDGTHAWCNKILKGRFDAFYLPSGHTDITFKPSANKGFKIDLYRRFSKR